MHHPGSNERSGRDHDSLIHDARNALAAARGQVDVMRRRVARGNLQLSDLDRGLNGARGSLDRLASLLDALDEFDELVNDRVPQLQSQRASSILPFVDRGAYRS